MKKLMGLASLSLMLFGCSAGTDRSNVELIQDMMDQISVKSQGQDQLRAGQNTSFVPPEGTVPIGYKPYPFGNDVLRAEKEGKNPIAGDFSPAIIEQGKAQYETYCMVCHGQMGKGDGPVGPKMLLKPPPLLSQKVRDYTDGRIFHVITKGQGVMGSYEQMVHDPQARWTLVNYVRSLQKSQPVSQ